MALVDAVTALRASELIALKWKNLGWDTGLLQSEFALVEGELKETKSRDNPLPLAQPVLEVLRLWREHTPYRLDEDWIFASPHFKGRTSYTYQILFRRHIRPGIERVSGLKSSKEAPIGWHTLRRSLATLLNLKRGERKGHAITTSPHHSEDNTRTLRTSRFSRPREGSQEGRTYGGSNEVSREIESAKRGCEWEASLVLKTTEWAIDVQPFARIQLLNRLGAQTGACANRVSPL
jgi:integrase